MNALRYREKIFNLDTWLDSFFEACDMISTIKKMQSLNIADYETWVGPSIKGYKLAIILDYDGTLVPLCPHPDLAVLTDEVKVLLEKLIQCPDIDICILSGRSLENLKQMIPIKDMNLAGSHGMEIQLAKMPEKECYEQALVFKPKVAELAQDLRDNVCMYGGWVEDKVYHVTFHWRETAINFRPTVIQKAKEIVQKHGFQAINAHCAVEARPPIGWDKGIY
jgi:trehalose 6-phosphate synthase/phosphatase